MIEDPNRDDHGRRREKRIGMFKLIATGMTYEIHFCEAKLGPLEVWKVIKKVTDQNDSASATNLQRAEVALNDIINQRQRNDVALLAKLTPKGTTECYPVE